MYATDEADGSGVRVAVKVVPSSRRDQIVGPLGDRLKIKVAAPPEDGRANDALCGLLASELGIKAAKVRVVAGHTNPEKMIRIDGVRASDLVSRWG